MVFARFRVIFVEDGGRRKERRSMKHLGWAALLAAVITSSAVITSLPASSAMAMSPGVLSNAATDSLVVDVQSRRSRPGMRPPGAPRDWRPGRHYRSPPPGWRR